MPLQDPPRREPLVDAAGNITDRWREWLKQLVILLNSLEP